MEEMVIFVIYCHILVIISYFIVTMSQYGVVLYANEAVIPEKPIRQPCVQSRMIVWCKKGRGTIESDHTAYPMAPGDFLWLPWNRKMVYSRELKDMFLVAGIHIVPVHDEKVPLVFNIAHSLNDPLLNVPYRRDADWPGIPEFYQGRFRTFPALEGLCEYIVRRFQEGSFNEWEARVLCEVLLGELRRSFARRASAEPLPPLLEKLTDRMRNDLCADYSLPVLAVELKTSISGVIRLFRKHLGATPGRYLILERMAAAERLLVTTGLPVRTVGERVGVGDEFYFSKLFKKEKGISALSFRKKHSL